MSHEAKFPIGNDRMLELLNKYPFLKHKKVWSVNLEDCYKTDAENIEHNHYKEWDGTGWEDLWKNRYLPRLFKWYDNLPEEDKKKFCFTQIKEKYGSMRIYTSFKSDDDLETIAEWLSEYTCFSCGKEPRDAKGNRIIWQTDGWITNLCEDCAKSAVSNTDEIKQPPAHFGYIRFSKNGNKRYLFKETADKKWLELESVTDEKENN